MGVREGPAAATDVPSGDDGEGGRKAAGAAVTTVAVAALSVLGAWPLREEEAPEISMTSSSSPPLACRRVRTPAPRMTMLGEPAAGGVVLPTAAAGLQAAEERAVSDGRVTTSQGLSGGKIAGIIQVISNA